MHENAQKMEENTVKSINWMFCWDFSLLPLFFSSCFFAPFCGYFSLFVAVRGFRYTAAARMCPSDFFARCRWGWSALWAQRSMTF